MAGGILARLRLCFAPMSLEKPHGAEELTALASSLRSQGEYAAAKEAALRAVRAQPDNAAAWFNLAAARAALREWAESEDGYRKALALRPRYAEAWSNLAGLLQVSGRQEEAIAAYWNGIAANDRLAPIWSNLCNALCDAGRLEEAERAGRRAVEVDPEFVPAWVNLGRALHAANRSAEALNVCRHAIGLAPRLADAWSGLGHALMGLRRFDEAVDAYGKAAALQPGNAHLHANLGVALRRMGSSDAAVQTLRRALELDHGNHFASWNLANALLEQGALAEGWQHYDARWKRPDAPPRRFAAKGGKPTSGRALIWGEQGVGDEILYAGMAAEVAGRGVDVTLAADKRLVGLFRRSFPGLNVCGREDPSHWHGQAFDHILPSGDLCAWLRRDWTAFPDHRGYLKADAARTALYRNLLEQRSGASALIVGIAWRSRNPEFGAEKSAALADWGPLLRVPRTTFVNLQYGDVGAECDQVGQRLGVRLVRLPEPDLHDDLDGLAALQAACDLIITTSNVTAHLAGALGRPGWVLLPRRIGRLWYWFHHRNDSPWYPSLSLIPQSRDGEWAGAMEAAAERLRGMVEGGR